MSDDERELHIESCGVLLLKAYAEGDLEAARHWLELQNAAVLGRSVQRVAEMERLVFDARSGLDFRG